MKLILVSLAFMLAIAAQTPTVTTIKNSQISGCGPNTILAFPPQLPGAPPSGNAVCLALPTGLQIVTVNGVNSLVVSSAGPVPNFSDAETPTGTTNGANAAFTLAHSPNPAISLILTRNGVSLRQGLDYALSGSTVTFVSAAIPQSSDVLQCWYRY